MIEGQDCRKVRLSCGAELRHALNHAENLSCLNYLAVDSLTANGSAFANRWRKTVGIHRTGGIVGVAFQPGWRNWQTRQT
jgi:hypothetical protein